MYSQFSKKIAVYLITVQARKAISLRAQMEKKVAQKEREQKEEKLRDLARMARDKRVGTHFGEGGEGEAGEGEEEEVEEEEEKEEEEEEVGEGDARERDVLRQERHRERERERRLARAHPDKRYVRMSRTGDYLGMTIMTAN